MRNDNKGSRMSMSWKTLTSGKLYGENDAKRYRSQAMQIKEEVSNKYRYMYLKIAWHLKTYIDTNSSIEFEKLH